jgi:hypothetical protein
MIQKHRKVTKSNRTKALRLPAGVKASAQQGKKTIQWLAGPDIGCSGGCHSRSKAAVSK